MFRVTLLLAFFSFNLLMAMDIDKIVNIAMNNNHDIKRLEKSIAVASKGVELSQKWSNPVVTIGANDIQFDDVSKRDLEPMQAEYIAFSQTIPLGNKLKIQKSIAQENNHIAKHQLEDKQLQLKAKVYELGYRIVLLEQKYDLLVKYQQNIHSQQKLLEALYTNGKVKQSELLNTQTAYTNMELQKESLNTMIKNLYLKLEQLSYTKVERISANIKPKNLVLNQMVESHPQLMMAKRDANRLMRQSALELSKKHSDMKVNVAYFSRDSKYEDYANISVSIPLSTYGTESLKAVQAKLKAQALNEQSVEIKHYLITQIKTLQNSLESAYKRYTIINEKLIPLKKQIQKSMELYNSLDQIKPQESIKSLNEIISYEMKRLDELENYYRLYAQSIYFTQGKE